LQRLLLTTVSAADSIAATEETVKRASVICVVHHPRPCVSPCSKSVSLLMIQAYSDDNRSSTYHHVPVENHVHVHVAFCFIMCQHFLVLDVTPPLLVSCTTMILWPTLLVFMCLGSVQFKFMEQSTFTIITCDGLVHQFDTTIILVPTFTVL
jgi:hypothetical protein